MTILLINIQAPHLQKANSLNLLFLRRHPHSTIPFEVNRIQIRPPCNHQLQHPNILMPGGETSRKKRSLAVTVPQLELGFLADEVRDNRHLAQSARTVHRAHSSEEALVVDLEGGRVDYWFGFVLAVGFVVVADEEVVIDLVEYCLECGQVCGVLG